MGGDIPSYSTIQHGLYFCEVIFADMKRSTVEQWLRGFDQRYPLLKQAPWIRILYDLREIYAISPYAIAVFENMAHRSYATRNICIAFVVGEDLAEAHLQFSTGEFFGRHRKWRGTARFFRERERALNWLRQGIPPNAVEEQPNRLSPV